MNLNQFFHLSTFKIDFLFVLISQRYTYLPKRMNFFGYINFKEFVWNPLILSNEWLNKEKLDILLSNLLLSKFMNIFH